MSDATIGTRDERGDWRPTDPISMPAPFAWPPRPVGILKWLFGFPGYLWPWNSLYLAIALVTWFFLTPDLASMRTFEAGWISLVFARNLAMMFVVVGAWHFYLYILKGQGTDFKFTSRPLATNNRAFLFGHQVRDNMFWTLASAVPIWTAYEVVTLWAYANGLLPFINWETNPVWFVALLLLIPSIRELHFYLYHRLAHWRPLYDSVHYLHHRNVNIGPWSGLSMHPVEHLLHFSGVVIHWVVVSHPIHALFHLQHAAFSPAKGHCGFDRIVVKGDKTMGTGNYYHYLHHKYFECNYGNPVAPLDKWFGTFHDGSDAAHALMKKRLSERLGSEPKYENRSQKEGAKTPRVSTAE